MAVSKIFVGQNFGSQCFDKKRKRRIDRRWKGEAVEEWVLEQGVLGLSTTGLESCVKRRRHFDSDFPPPSQDLKRLADKFKLEKVCSDPRVSKALENQLRDQQTHEQRQLLLGWQWQQPTSHQQTRVSILWCWQYPLRDSSHTYLKR